MKELIDQSPWTDWQYPCTAIKHAPLPLTTVTQQTSWRDNLANRVRWQLGHLLPHDFAIVEGVEVKRTTWNSKLVYIVACGRGTTSLEIAVGRVCELVSERSQP